MAIDYGNYGIFLIINSKTNQHEDKQYRVSRIHRYDVLHGTLRHRQQDQRIDQHHHSNYSGNNKNINTITIIINIILIRDTLPTTAS